MTLNELAFSIIDIMSHGRSVNNTYQTNERLVKFWIKQYRALLIRRDLNQNGIAGFGQRLLEYEQEIEAIEFIELNEEERGRFTDMLGHNRPVLRTVLPVPNFIRLRQKPAITYVGPTDRSENYPLADYHAIQYVTRYNKYTNNESRSIYVDNHIYITNPSDIPPYTTRRRDANGNQLPRAPQLYMIRGIFEDPNEAWKVGGVLSGDDTPNYPVPLDFAQRVAQSILNGEARAILGSPNDTILNALPDEVNSTS